MAVANILVYHNTVVKSLTVQVQGIQFASLLRLARDNPGNTILRGRLSTVDLLIKVACVLLKTE
jgi:hypothetical protein